MIGTDDLVDDDDVFLGLDDAPAPKAGKTAPKQSSQLSEPLTLDEDEDGNLFF